MLFASTGRSKVSEYAFVFAECASYVDGIELRLDLLHDISVDALQEVLFFWHKPIIFTLRREDQGGKCKLPKREREQLWMQLLELGPDYIDLEWDTDPSFIDHIRENFPKVKIISSYHDFLSTPQDLTSLFRKVQCFSADVYKIVTMALTIVDALNMLAFVQGSQEKIIGLCMGEEGKITRILSPLFGGFLTFAPLKGEVTAPGQIDCLELHDVYHFAQLSKETKFYGVIGYPIDKSIGHFVHNALFSRFQDNAVYVKMRLQEKDLSSFFSLVRTFSSFSGLSITMPLKEASTAYVDRIEGDAKQIGCINTVVREEGKLIGYNTDGIGARRALERNISLAGKRVLVLGAGGGAKAIAYTLMQAKADVCILNRTLERAKSLSSQLSCEGGGLDLMEAEYQRGYDVLVNTTPHQMPFDPQWIRSGAVVMDIKNLPKDTELLQEAAKRGCILVYGYEMYVEQALEQQKLWFAGRGKEEQVLAILREETCKHIS